MVTVNCSRCGRPVPEEDLVSRRARIVNDRLVCAACAEGTAGKQPARDGTRKQATGTGARPVTGHLPSGSGMRPAVARPAAREGRGGGPAAVAAAALAAGVIGAGLIYLYGYRPAARIPPAEHAKGVAAKKAEDAREASAGTANPAIVAEERARADYDELVRFEGLDPSDKDGKIARIRAYLAKHGNTIQAARARKLMEDIAAGGPAQAPLPSPGSDGRHAAEKPLRRDTSGSRDADSREPVSKTADRPATQDGVASTSSPATGTGSGIGTGSSGTGTKAPDAGPSGPDTRKRPSNPEARPAEPAKTAAKPEDRTPGPESQAAAPGGREAIGEGKTASAAARAVFLDELMGLLRKRDTAGAEALLKKAAQDPAFAAGHPTAASYARMTAWADALDRAVAAALEKLKESGDLEAELRTTRGATMKVGGEGAYRIVSVADGILMVAGRGVTVPVPIDQLTNGTREELARLALPLDGRGWLLRAFAAMLAADPAAGTPAVRAREDIVKAAEAGAQAEDVELLKALLPAAERGAVEAMAAEAWSEISRLAADRKWDEARAALADFQKAFGSTKLAAAKKEEAETILKSADRAGVPAEGLIGFWKFDEGKETRAGDYGGAGNHGNIKIPSYAPGRSGMALSFDKNCVDLPLGILGTAKGSLAFWMLAARPPSDMGIVFYGSDGERGDGRGGAPGEFHVHLAADGRVGLLIRGQGRGLDMKSPGRVADGEWHHVVVTWENGRGAAIYVDGIMVARDEFKIADFQFSGRCRFGVPGYPTRHYSGLLDEARAYNRPLSESEVRRLARQ